MEKVQAAKAASQYFELPLVASTSLDWFLGKEAADTTLQKRRGAIRSALGLTAADVAWMRKASLGRKGSFQLEPSLVLMCLQTEMRWPKAPYLNTLSESFSVHGLPQLVRSSTFMALAEMIVKTVEAVVAAQSATPDVALGRTVNHAIRQMSASNLVLRRAAHSYSQIMCAVAEALPELDRFPGHVVRVEGPESLILVETPEGEDLRWVDSDYLTTFGLDEADAPFVLMDQHWSPDVRTSYFQPAIVESGVSSDELAEIEKDVRQHERPMREANVPSY